MRRALALVGATIALSGCYRSHQREDVSVARDAGRDAGRDAEAPHDAGSPCVTAIEWIDPVPLIRPIDTVIAPSLAGSDEGFELAYRHVSPELCDGPCPAALRVPPEGPQPAVHDAHPMYWADWSDLTRVEARTDRSDQPWFVAIGAGRVAWARAPEPGWSAAAQVEVDREIGDVAFGEETVWIETHEQGPTGEARAMRILEHATSGEPIADHDGSVLTHGFEYRAPMLRTSRGGELVIGFTQDVDSPPTVHLGNLDDHPRLPWSGSSCGVSAFDFSADGLNYVVERCGDRVVMELLRGDFPTDVLDVSGAHHALGSPRIAPHDTGVLAAYWHADGSARVHVFDRAPSEVASDTIPGSALLPGESPGGLAVATSAAPGRGYVLAVVWTHLAADGAEVPSYGALQRFRLCE